MGSELVYFVVSAPDAERIKAFFGPLLGWDFTEGRVPGGFNIEGSTPHGGVFGGAAASPGIGVYFSVDDLEAAVVKVRELGGEAGKIEGSEAGRYCACKDDQGTAFSLFEAPHST